MTSTIEILYWRLDAKWYVYNQENEEFSLTERAPERAVKSFELWKKIHLDDLAHRVHSE